MARSSTKEPAQPAQGSLQSMRRRSSQLGNDPKVKELQHFLGSKQHEERLKEAVRASEMGRGERPKTPNSLMLKLQDLRRNEQEESRTAYNSPVGSCEARLQWRDEMDRQIRRLMQDTELALQDDLMDTDRDRLRCGQLDKMFDWFSTHGKKEAAKERKAPPYLTFDSNAPVMPGSLRRDPNHAVGRRGPGSSISVHGGLGHTSSRPVHNQPLPAGLLSSAAREIVHPQERMGASKRDTSSQWRVPSRGGTGLVGL